MPFGALDSVLGTNVILSWVYIISVEYDKKFKSVFMGHQQLCYLFYDYKKVYRFKQIIFLFSGEFARHPQDLIVIFNASAKPSAYCVCIFAKNQMSISKFLNATKWHI